MTEEKQIINAWKVTRCYKELKAIVDEYEGTPPTESRNVQFKDRIMESLEKHGDMVHKEMHVKSVGAMPNNRGGEGLLWERAQSRASKIKASGFSREALENNAVVVQDNPYTRAFAHYTFDRCQLDDRYARYVLEEVEAANVGATHATHGFACVHDEVPSTYTNICVDGKMSRAKVFNNDPNYKHAVEIGVMYKYIRWQVYAALPKAIEIISDALNTVMQIGEG